MRFSAHPERQSAFEKMLSEQGFLHGKCKRGAPWQNGIVERSHRTDNEELFQRIRFATSEDRRYQLRLWEHEYNNHRPHQGIGGRTPLEVYLSEYRCHASTRMLT